MGSTREQMLATLLNDGMCMVACQTHGVSLMPSRRAYDFFMENDHIPIRVNNAVDEKELLQRYQRSLDSAVPPSSLLEQIRSSHRQTTPTPPSSSPLQSNKAMPAGKASNKSGCEDTDCPICHESYDTGENPETPVTLKCGHKFGSLCAAEWLHVKDRTHGVRRRLP